MRLNGWQRLGIVVSICWIVGGGLWINGKVIDEMAHPVVSEYQSCLNTHSAQSDDSTPADTDCSAKFDADFGPAVSNHWSYSIALTFIPIPVAWLTVYGLIGLVKWIRAGFKPI